MSDLRESLLDAALPHVAFDGWSVETFRAACSDAGIDANTARGFCPRGAVDLAVAYHRRGDRQMQARAASEDLSALRYRDRVAALVRYRLEAGDREAVRRGVALFALPQHAVEGARLIWDTADTIWVALGDTSDDINWFSKRAILSGVYSSTVLFWLGDTTPGYSATWAFLDRRIEDVMQFEKFKGRLLANSAFKKLLESPMNPFNRVRALSAGPKSGYPGHLGGDTE